MFWIKWPRSTSPFKWSIRPKNPTQAFFLGPDDLRIELLADDKLTTVSENHQVHFFTPDVDAMQKWYVTNFGATPVRRSAQR
jgi:outer membrane lipoprotein-sorting protein